VSVVDSTKLGSAMATVMATAAASSGGSSSSSTGGGSSTGSSGGGGATDPLTLLACTLAIGFAAHRRRAAVQRK
jgi:hypothetical protein